MKILKKILYFVAVGLTYGYITTALNFAGIQLGAIGTIILLIILFFLFKVIFKSEKSDRKSEQFDNKSEESDNKTN